MMRKIRNILLSCLIALAVILPGFSSLAGEVKLANAAAAPDIVGKADLPTAKLPVFMQTQEDRAEVERLMKEAYLDMTAKGFNMGQAFGDSVDGQWSEGVRQWPNGIAVQEFRNYTVGEETVGDHAANLWGRVHGLIMLGTIAEGFPCGVLTNNMFRGWKDNYDSQSTLKWGFPIGNQFEIGSGNDAYTYQNFSNGYAFYHGGFLEKANKTTSFVSGKHMQSNGVAKNALEVPPFKTQTGLLAGNFPNWASASHGAAITNAFKDAYTLISTTDVVKEGGYNLGNGNTFVDVWQPESVVMSQAFIGGDNKGKSYDAGAKGFLMLNAANGKAFPLLDSQLTMWASKGGFRTVGYPMSYPFKVGNNTIQVFSKSYMLLDYMNYPEVISMSPGAIKINEDGEVSSDFVKASFNIFNAFKNYNNTIGNFGYPLDYVKKHESANVYYQEFIGGDHQDKTAKIISSGEDYLAFAVKGEALNVFEAQDIKAIGGPLSKEMVVSGKTYQNFAKGYVNVTDKTFVSGKAMTLDGEVVIGEYTLHANVGEKGSFNMGGFTDPVSLKAKVTKVAESLLELGYDLKAPVDKMTGANGGAIQRFEATQSHANGVLAIAVASPSAEAFAVKNQFLFALDRLTIGKVGYPSSNEIVVGNKIYQNFTNGYISIDSNRHANFTENINVLENGTFVNAKTGAEVANVPNRVGVLGADEKVPALLRGYQEEIKEAFVKEYTRIQRLGINPGNPDDDGVHQWAPPGLSWVNQTFLHGESTANVFDMNNVVKIFMINLNDGCFSLYDDMFVAWANLGNVSMCGYPIGNQFYYKGDLYQNFFYGYIKCPNGESDTAVFVEGQKFVIPTEGAETPGKQDEGCSSQVALNGQGLAAGISALLVLVLIGFSLKKGEK